MLAHLPGISDILSTAFFHIYLLQGQKCWVKYKTDSNFVCFLVKLIFVRIRLHSSRNFVASYPVRGSQSDFWTFISSNCTLKMSFPVPDALFILYMLLVSIHGWLISLFGNGCWMHKRDKWWQIYCSSMKKLFQLNYKSQMSCCFWWL